MKGKMKIVKIIFVATMISMPVYLFADEMNSTLTQTNSGKMEMGMDEMTGFYGLYPMSREASGTAWQPEASPMGGVSFMKNDWMFMLHGFADGVYDYQGGNRGDKKFYSPNMIMGMAQRSVGESTFGFRTMLSLEPATIGRTGYPLLLQ